MATERRRIVVDLDAVSRDARALNTAVDLAQWADAELAGVFIADANLFRLGALPFAAEIGLATAVWRPLGSADVEDMLRLQAERLQRRLAAAAREPALRWSFEVGHGAALAALLASSGDAVVIGGKAGYGRVQGGAGQLPSGTAIPSGLRATVAVIVEGGPVSVRALEAARALARRRAAEVLVVTVAGKADSGAGRRRTDADAPKERVLRLPDVLPERLARSLSGVQALFWPAAAAGDDPEMIESVRRFLDCPVVLVR